MRDRIIRIRWSEPLDLESAIESQSSNTTGLYYITTVLNKEISLYIGIARGYNTIKRRLIAHREDWLKYYRGNIQIRIGKIIYPHKPTDEMIYDAESAIVYNNNFLLDNRAKINSYTYTELYRIENIGDIFEIPPIIQMKYQ